MVRGRRPERLRRVAGSSWSELALGAAFTGTLVLGFGTPLLAQTSAGGSVSGFAGSGASGAGAAATAGGQVGPTAPGSGSSAGIALPGSSNAPFRGAAGSGITLPNLFGGRSPIEPPSLSYGIRSVASLSDNENLGSSGNEKADLRLEASPWIEATSDAPRANYRVLYQMRNFFRLRDFDFDLARHALNGSGSFALVGDNLWIDASAFVGSIGSATDANLSYDPTSYQGSTNYRNFSISPWYQNRLGSWANYNLRYRYSKSGGRDSLLLADNNQEVTAAVNGIDWGSRWNWGWQGYFQRSSYDVGTGFTRDRRTSTGTLFYRVSNTLRLSGSIVYEQIDFVFNEDGEDHGWGPGVGVQWNPNSRASFDVSLSERYYGTVGSARASWTTRRTTLGLSYGRSIITNSNDLLFNLDPRDLTSVAPGFSNPVLGDLGSRGIALPGITTVPGAFISDAATFDERLTGYFALRGAGRALTLSVYVSDRSSTSQIEQRPNPGTGIRGGGTSGQLAAFRGDLRENGATLVLHQTLDARSRLEAAIERRQVESPSAGFDNQLDTIRAGVITDLTSTTRGFAGIRRSVQDSQGNRGNDYTEHVVFVGFDVRFR
jgi:uncharacterized protein (PEP-CTERM system associated)